MNLEPFTGPGSTPSRRRFWDKVAAAVNASQKLAGHNTSVSEHPGKGTFINVDSLARRTKPVPQPEPPPTDTGACCNEGVCTQTTEGDCTGDFKGVGIPCDPNPCCSDCPNLFHFGCDNGNDPDVCRVGPETCDGCDDGGSEIIPCDSTWLVMTEYCFVNGCPDSTIVQCSQTVINPETCEEVVTGSCDDCVTGSTQSVSSRVFPCPTLSPPP